MMSRVISLGLNGFAGSDHDAAAALVVDGRVVAAVEEERLNRHRHAPGSRPTLAVPEVLRIAGVRAADIDVVCHGWRPDALGLDLDPQRERETIRTALAAAGVALPAATPIEFVDHHLAHYWSAVPFLPSEVDRTAIDGLVVDGAGESTSGALFRWRDGELSKTWNLGLAGSLGLLYEAATVALGMRPGDEGKTMGLASYGRLQTMLEVPAPPDDRFDGQIPKLGDRGEIRHQHRSQVLRVRSVLPATASFNHRADLALGVQHQVQARMMAYLAEIADPAPALVMAGGVALNCTINAAVGQWCAGRGATLTVPPPANDAGIAIGAAVAVSPGPVACTAEGACLGRDYQPGEIVSRLAALGVAAQDCSPEELARDLFERDLVCGWFEGRAEMGPRALGKRAVLARPDSTRTRDRLNVLKGREHWRPLAPSLLREDFHRVFQGTPSSYMLVAADAKPAALRLLAGVVHVDNTARPQVVDGRPGERPFRDLLRAVRARTGHGAVTCTSFNPAGQPIVYTPEEAYRAAVDMRLDLLAGDGWCARIPGS
jgi:carbamoyltransferase